MATFKRLRAPLIVMSGAILGLVALAGPASAAGGTYPPPSGVQVLDNSVTVAAAPKAAAASVPAGAAASTTGLAFTGTNAIGIGALGGLLLVGGGAMVFVGKRRKIDA